MTISATAKTKVFIGTNDRAASLTEYQADAYVEIKETESLGEFGASRQEITFSGVGDAFVRRRAGVTDSGSMELVCARDPLDAGQEAARDAVKDPLPYNFKVVLSDKPSSTGTPTTFFFSAVVLASRNTLGSANDITKITFTVGIDGEILEVPAAA